MFSRLNQWFDNLKEPCRGIFIIVSVSATMLGIQISPHKHPIIFGISAAWFFFTTIWALIRIGSSK